MEHKLSTMVVNFIIRAIFGSGLIIFINQYILTDQKILNVGLNALSVLTSGTLGIPGVCLLYGILFYQNFKYLTKSCKFRNGYGHFRMTCL